MDSSSSPPQTSDITVDQVYNYYKNDDNNEFDFVSNEDASSSSDFSVDKNSNHDWVDPSFSPSSVPTIETIPLDAMNVLTSYLLLSDFVSLSVCSTKMYGTISKASHLYMDDPFVFAQRGLPCNTSSSHHASVDSPPPSSRRFASSLRVSDQILTRLLSRYQNLRTLHLSGMGAIGDSLFSILNRVKAARYIQSLSLDGVSLTYWCQDALQLENLQELRIASCSIRASLQLLVGVSNAGNGGQLSSTSGNGSEENSTTRTRNTTRSTSTTTSTTTISQQPRISKLQSLSISQGSSLRDDQLRALLTHLNGTLKNLSLTQCLRLRSPRIAMERLEKLNLMGSFALQDLPALQCPMLRSLNLSFCFRLSNDSIRSIVNALSSQLEELVLAKCLLLQDLSLESKTLQNLNVGYCDALHRVQLTCPQLQVLDTSACSSLDTLILHQADALKDLNVSVLPVTRLEIMAPQLSELNLAHCRRLNRCSIHAPSLQRVNLRGCRTVALRFCKEVRSVQIRNWTRLPVLKSQRR